ncbi:MAG: Rpn family recombination-promoting nuclease/putative transposase, partial [Clostridium butyricum]|nr:Rpn family recombination-promoting nuclease/putative transposase [Clostridium butyricum]MDU5822035.1 Rpn family recombination-promoting nuclease/putative transposase [Clostridium butyricum]
ATFLEFLRSFTKKEWANLIKEEDLILVDKSYILSDFEEEESDILYKVKIDDKEVIFYVLLEFQSKVDFQMPMRLLFYMTEVWRDILKNTDKNQRKRKAFKLPAIIPIVLYNGKNKWTANMNFKEMLSGYELFEDNIVNFKYMLFDINRYDDEELLNMSNLVSAIFLLDQEMNEEELIRRLRKIIYVLKKISPEQFSVFKQWLKNIVKPRLREEMQEEVDDVLNKSNQEEVDVMVSNLGKTLDNIEKKGIEKGIEKKAREIAIKAIKMGMDNSVVSELTGLKEDEINIIRKEVNH